MIYQITGQPGHGKTLRGVALAKKFKAEGRLVYAHGVPGLDYERLGFLRLEEPKKWEDLPDNVVVLIDECYNVFPNRNAATHVPAHVEPLARHRHRGFDFILIHQQPNQLDPFVRGLVERHEHVRRKFGSPVSVIRTFDRSATNPDKEAPIVAPLWKHERPNPPDYVSTTQDTTRRSVPWFVWIIVPLLGFVLWEGKRITSGEVIRSASAAPPAPAKAGVGGVVGARMSERDYAAWLRPRVPGIPWTAPAYDGLQPTETPMLYCMSTPDSCTCLTEQGTRLPVARKVCRKIARDGVYNPFRKALQQQNQAAPFGYPDADQAQLQDAPAGIRTPPSQVGAGERMGQVW